MKNGSDEWDAKEINTKAHDDLVTFLMNRDNLFKSILNKGFKFGMVDNKNLKLGELEIKTELPVTYKTSSYSSRLIAGYIDLFVQLPILYNTDLLEEHYKNGWQIKEVLKVAIEVKPAITNFGDLVRQINKYKNYIDNEKIVWTVYTKKCSEEYRKLLASQRIFVYVHKE